MLVQIGNTNSTHPEPSVEAVTTFCWEPEILKAGLKQPESHAKAPEGLGTAGRPGDTQLRGPLAQSQAVVLTTAEKSGQNFQKDGLSKSISQLISFFYLQALRWQNSSKGINSYWLLLTREAQWGPGPGLPAPSASVRDPGGLGFIISFTY